MWLLFEVQRSEFFSSLFSGLSGLPLFDLEPDLFFIGTVCVSFFEEALIISASSVSRCNHSEHVLVYVIEIESTSIEIELLFVVGVRVKFLEDN